MSHLNRPVTRLIQSCDHAKQGALATSRGANQRNKLVFIDFETDVVERIDVVRTAQMKAFTDAINFDERLRRRHGKSLLHRGT